MKKLQRNQLCPCGSGLKYKKCHGDVVKIEMCKKVAAEKMKELIEKELYEKAIRNQEKKTGRHEGGSEI